VPFFEISERLEIELHVILHIDLSGFKIFLLKLLTYILSPISMSVLEKANSGNLKDVYTLHVFPHFSLTCSNTAFCDSEIFSI
jgi:hypothetical protein